MKPWPSFLHRSTHTHSLTRAHTHTLSCAHTHTHTHVIFHVHTITPISLSLSPPPAPLDGVYVVGSLEEALSIRGFRYHPADIEATVIRCHKNIIGRYTICDGTRKNGATDGKTYFTVPQKMPPGTYKHFLRYCGL